MAKTKSKPQKAVNRKWSNDRYEMMSRLMDARKEAMRENFRKIVHELGIDYLELAATKAERRLAARIYKDGIGRGGDSYLVRFASKIGLSDYRALFQKDFNLAEGARQAASELAEIRRLTNRTTQEPSDAKTVEKMRREAEWKFQEASKSPRHIAKLLAAVEAVYDEVDPTELD